MIQKPRGTIDVLPEDIGWYRHIEEAARRVCERYGFSEVRFPTFENTELFNRGVGETTDVVEKEMYTFEDREGRSYTLRPEGTASVARMLIENGRLSDPMPLKLFYLINCFRYEKPQAGRSREFFQFGTEVYGSSSPAADAFTIATADAFLREVGVTNASLRINSIGCSCCRPKYREALTSYYREHYAELCDTCKERLEKNPLRILDCKNPSCEALKAGAPRTIDNLCDDCRDHMDKLEGYLSGQNIKYEIDPGIVRGLDYYTRTVFEFVAPVIGAQSTVLGGGRYDRLMSDIGGPDIPGIGFAAGITRLILAGRECGVQIPEEKGPTLYIASLGQRAVGYALCLCEKLRDCGVYAETDVVGRSLKSQMKYADKKKAKYTLIVGDGEIESGRANIRNMQNGEQTEVDVNDTDGIKEKLI